jgi:hypothetical protein
MKNAGKYGKFVPLKRNGRRIGFTTRAHVETGVDVSGNPN